ncbi:COG1361 S-layer family protein [Halobaculum magnesiiphilum]|uniref:COG1361 S-layer family protein n=1 Tax=Halobaculum magnesiiphilum TaxID=1017351 RepID=A0A8T8WFK9_9EURY|nr:COG1361 S-layer family protein [Halobaculum magnesiiphilum]QZP38647.1 COG1361 S-layer family protein [Halobaculum magnesiiphilum]
MSRRPQTLLIAALLVVSAVGTGFVGVVAADEDPRFETDVAEPVIQPGTTQELTIELTNDAADRDDRVEAAIDVNATVGDIDGIEVLSSTRDLGRMGDGATRSVTVQIDVAADIPGGEHRVPITVKYRDEDDEDEVVTETVYATVRVQERARFEIEDVESAAPVGGSGTVSATVRNVGGETATNAVLALQSGNSDLSFGDSANARRFVGTLAPNETRTVEVDATLVDSAETREYAVDATVEYETEGGESATSRPLSFGVLPLPEQTFGVDDLASTLRVGEEGQVTGTVTNTGEETVTNAVVLFEASNPNVSPLEPEVAVGTLEPGESAEFAFDVEVSDAAEAGPRQFTLRVQYRDTEGTRRTGDSIDAPVSIAESRDEFAVSPVNGTFEVGGGGTLTLEVTNNRDEIVRDVSAKLFLDAPLSSSDDEGFIAELAPGETREVTFALSMAGGAIDGKTYPASVDFRYETADGDTLISDTYEVPIEAAAPGGNGLPLGAIGVAAVVVALGLVGGVYLRRNR